MAEACCTCATLLSNIEPFYDERTEKPKALDRHLQCCNRVVCGRCIYNNPRFEKYCLFCPISTTTTIPQGLRHSPAYSPPSSSIILTTSSSNPPPSYADDFLPSYTSLNPTPHPLPEEKSHSAEDNDVLHFLDHDLDTITSLSLRYKVPIPALRRANNITSDHLLLARRTILIPGEYYKGGVSLSPRPLEGEEEELRKSKIRRWMVACKVAEYDVALLYLNQADYNLEEAIEAYRDDERWEMEHPLDTSVKGKAKAKYDLGRRRFTGQRS